MLALEELLKGHADAAFYMARLGFEKVVDRVITSNLPTVEDFQAAQMFSGKKADGQDILPDYTQTTKRVKRKKGQPFDRVTLRDKGDFQEAIKAIYDAARFSIFITSTDVKTAMLVAKYGNAIFGLDDTFLASLLTIVEDEVIEETCKEYVGS